jgi:hypothetical protein
MAGSKVGSPISTNEALVRRTRRTKLLEAIEPVAAIAHHFACLAYTTELLGQPHGVLRSDQKAYGPTT